MEYHNLTKCNQCPRLLKYVEKYYKDKKSHCYECYFGVKLNERFGRAETS